MFKINELTLKLKNISLSEKQQVPYGYIYYDDFYVKQDKKHSHKMICFLMGTYMEINV